MKNRADVLREALEVMAEHLEFHGKNCPTCRTVLATIRSKLKEDDHDRRKHDGRPQG